MKKIIILFLSVYLFNFLSAQNVKNTDNQNKLNNCANCTSRDSKGNCLEFDFSICQADVVKANFKNYKDIALTEKNQVKLQKIVFKDFKKGILNSGWVASGNYNGSLILVNTRLNQTGTLNCGCCKVIISDNFVTCQHELETDCKKCYNVVIVSLSSLSNRRR